MADTAKWQEIKRVTVGDRDRYLTIMKGPHEVFRFEAFKWIDSCEEDEGVLGEAYWDCDHLSGLYESAASAERDA
jgi:hypothetical protein